MKAMDKLADWLSGGKLSLYKEQREHCLRGMHEMEREVIRLRKAIMDVKNYTAPQKSGTAQKVTRMCEEVLK